MAVIRSSHLRLWLALALVTTVAAQFASIPTCAQQCVTRAENFNDCNSDPDCVCLSIQNEDLASCVCRACSQPDALATNTTIIQFCGSHYPGLICDSNTPGATNTSTAITASATGSSNTGSPTSSTTATQTSTTSSSAAGGQSASKGLSTGAIAGIGAGIGCIALLLIGVLFFFCRSKVHISFGSGSKDATKPAEKFDNASTPSSSDGSGAGKPELSSTEQKSTALSPTVTELYGKGTPVSPYSEIATSHGNTSSELAGHQQQQYAQIGARYAEIGTKQGNSHELGNHGEMQPRYAEMYTTHGNSHELSAPGRRVEGQGYAHGPQGIAELPANSRY